MPTVFIGSLGWGKAGELPFPHERSGVAEVRGEAVHGPFPDGTILGGLVSKSPWGIKFDAGAFGGLSRGLGEAGNHFWFNRGFQEDSLGDRRKSA